MTRQAFRDTLWVLFVITLLTVALIAKADPALFRLKTPGSFEYIRHGDRLAERGNFREAVHYYEKAYRSSPDSDIIRAELAWMYTQYGRSLLASQKYAEAILYLSKACALIQNPVTVQNVAMGYAYKALFEVRRADLARAVKDFARARSVAEVSGRASEGLALFLYGEALADFRAKRDERAIFILNESLLVGDSARALELLGDIYYRMNALDQVSFYWARASALDPRNRSLAEKAGRIAREIELARSEEKKTLAHFDLRYDAKLPIDPAVVAEALERAYAGVSRDLKFSPRGKTTVYLYAEDEFRSLFKLPREVRAFYDGAIRMPLPQGPLGRDEMMRYIIHEYTHAAISAMTEDRFPLWFNEGIAVRMQFAADPAAARKALAQIDDIGQYTLDGIDAAFRTTPRDESARLARYYILAYTVVEYIADTFGADALRGILARVKTGQHVANAIDDQLLMSEKEFEKRWRLFVTRQIGSGETAAAATERST